MILQVDYEIQSNGVGNFRLWLVRNKFVTNKYFSDTPSFTHHSITVSSSNITWEIDNESILEEQYPFNDGLSTMNLVDLPICFPYTRGYVPTGMIQNLIIKSPMNDTTCSIISFPSNNDNNSEDDGDDMETLSDAAPFMMMGGMCLVLFLIYCLRAILKKRRSNACECLTRRHYKTEEEKRKDQEERERNRRAELVRNKAWEEESKAASRARAKQSKQNFHNKVQCSKCASYGKAFGCNHVDANISYRC
eukprot:28905_1